MRFRGACVAGFAALLLSGVALAAASSDTVSLPSVLAAQITKAERAGVRVLIPSQLAAGVPASKLHASGGATAHGYDIQLAAAPGCDDSSACFVAEFWGGPGSLNISTKVALSKGIGGRFHPSACGASCAPAEVEWLEFGDRYMIQFIGSRAALVTLADSAIEAGPR
jgi:hypothetical protein